METPEDLTERCSGRIAHPGFRIGGLPFGILEMFQVATRGQLRFQG